jgi:topoisomerase IA-like protein
MPQTRRAKQAGSAALDRLRASIEAAENALKDLQGEVSRDSRDLLKDIGKTLKATQRNLTRSRRRIAKDIEHLEHALVKGKLPTRSEPKAATSASRSSASKAARTKGSAKRTTAKRTTAKRTTAKRTTVKRRAKTAKVG